MSEWITVKKAAEYSGYTTRHVRHLLEQGLIDGEKFGPVWRTTKDAVDKYLASNPRPGPKSEDKNE